MSKTKRNRAIAVLFPLLLAGCESGGSTASAPSSAPRNTSASAQTRVTLGGTNTASDTQGSGGSLGLGGAATTLDGKGTRSAGGNGNATRSSGGSGRSATSVGTVASTRGGSIASGGTATSGGGASGDTVASPRSGTIASGGTVASTRSGTIASGGTNSAATVGGNCGDTTARDYDQTVLCDQPVAYWAMNNTSGSEPDLTSRGNAGTYRGGALSTTTLPNGDAAVVFDGNSANTCFAIDGASKALFSIPTTGNFVWEAWIKPSVLEFPNDGGSGYVDWMGKCADYSPLTLAR